MLPDGSDDFDIQGVDQMEPVDNGADAFANVGQGLVGEHKTAMLQYWQQAIDDIERISEDGADTDVFKSTVLPLARIKKVMKTDSEVRMISAEAPILFAKGCDIFITELTMRAWIHAEENKRRTLQRSDIATAIQKSDVFDFLIDIVPREEGQPRRSSYRAPDQGPRPSSSQTMQPAGMAGMEMQGPGAPMPDQMPGQIPTQMPGQIPGQMPGQLPSQLPTQIPGQLPGQLPGQIPGQIHGQMRGALPNQIPNQMDSRVPNQMNQMSDGQDMGYNQQMPNSLSNLGALSSIANLSNLNGIDLNTLGSMPMSYDNGPISTGIGGYGESEMPFQGQGPAQAGEGLQRSELMQDNEQQFSDSEQTRSRVRDQERERAPSDDHQHPERDASQIESQQSPNGSSRSPQSFKSMQSLQYSEKDEDGGEENTRYDSRDLRFAPYGTDSVDVSAFGQNF